VGEKGASEGIRSFQFNSVSLHLGWDKLGPGGVVPKHEG